LLIGLTDSPSYTHAELSRWNRWLGSGASRKSSGSRYSRRAGGLRQRQFVLENAPHQHLGQPVRRCVTDQLVERPVEGRPEPCGGGQFLLQERPRVGLVERLGQQVVEQVDLDALGPQLLGEGVVLLPRPLGPHDVVEEQVVDVLRGEPGELQAGSVQDHLAELPDLGVDVERHDGCSFFGRDSGVLRDATPERRTARTWRSGA
jgi:hypothetical protein